MLHELFSRYDAMLEKHHVYKVETIGGGWRGGWHTDNLIGNPTAKW